MKFKTLRRVPKLEKGQNMKKRLLIGPMLVLLAVNNQCVQASYSYDVDMNNLSYSNAFDMNTTDFSQFGNDEPGNGNNLIVAIGLDPAMFGELGITGQSLNSWYRYGKSTFSSIFSDKSNTAEENVKRDKNNMQLIGNYYIQAGQGDFGKAASMINKDIQALDKMALLKNSTNRTELEAISRLAKNVRGNLAQVAIKQDRVEKKKEVSGKLLSEALQEAELNLQMAANASEKKIYQDIVHHLKLVKAEVDRFKRSHNGLVKAIEACNKELLIAQKAQSQNSKSQPHAQKVEILTEALAQLNLEEAQQHELDSKKKTDIQLVREKIAKQYDVQDSGKNPARRLELAERDLVQMQANFDSMMKYSSGHTARDIEDAKDNLALQNKVIISLKADQDKFGNLVNAKIQQVVASSQNDPKKGLTKLIDTSKKTDAAGWSWSNPLASETENQKIERIIDAVEKAAAKQLQKQIVENERRIQAEQSNSSYNVANVGNDASNIMTSLDTIVNNALAKTGSKIPAHKQPQVAAILAKTRDTLLEISQKVPAQYQAQEKNNVLAGMSQELQKLLLVDFTNVSYEALQSRDPLTIATDVLINKLSGSLLGS